jgi:hypothetical protein
MDKPVGLQIAVSLFTRAWDRSSATYGPRRQQPPPLNARPTLCRLIRTWRFAMRASFRWFKTANEGKTVLSVYRAFTRAEKARS